MDGPFCETPLHSGGAKAPSGPWQRRPLKKEMHFSAGGTLFDTLGYASVAATESKGQKQVINKRPSKSEFLGHIGST